MLLQDGRYILGKSRGRGGRRKRGRTQPETGDQNKSHVPLIELPLPLVAAEFLSPDYTEICARQIRTFLLNAADREQRADFRLRTHPQIVSNVPVPAGV
jgi:hypothetical protein